MVRRPSLLAVPWSLSSSQRSEKGKTSSSRILTANAHDTVFMAEHPKEHNDARSHQLSTSKWRRPSLLSKRRADQSTASSTTQPTPTSSTAPAPAQVSTSNSTNTTTTSTSNTSATAASSSSPPALVPAPDSKKEIKRLLRDRDDDTATTTASDRDSECSRPMKALEDQAARRALRAASAIDLRVPSTLVPDSLPIQPGQDIPDAAPFRAKYNIYNPVGPKRYMNHHLIPPHTRMPLSSTFSPSFPPLSTAIGGGAGGAGIGIGAPPTTLDAGRMPVLNRTPSGSPLPTPTASQTRLGDGFHPKRTRKLSNTAHDNVDMLDGSDPLGMNWHHQSPYDVGGLNGPGPAAPQEVQPLGRLRTTSASAPRQNGINNVNGRPANPSPLSQSTSAVHLAEPPHATHPRKRTLSRPAHGIRRFFSNSSEDVSKDVKVSSAPTTPVETEEKEADAPQRKLSKRGRTAPPILLADTGTSLLAVPSSSTDKKEKRASFMNRIGKKFSVLRKPLNEHHSFMDHRRNENQGQGEYRRERRPSLSSSIKDGTVQVSLPRKLSKRTPPSASERREENSTIARRTSASIDIDIPLTMGKLTVANPDQPSSETASPVNLKATKDLNASPQSSVAPLPPPKNSSFPPLIQDFETEDDEPQEKSVLRVTNTPDRSHDATPEQERNVIQSAPQPQPHPSQPSQSLQQSVQKSAPVLPEIDRSLSPLLPPPPLTQHNIPSIPSFFSPAVISVSLSTADFSSPPPVPDKAFVDPATLTDSPMTSEMDMDHMPDIATEPDYDRRAETPTPVPPVPPLPASPPVTAPAPASSTTTPRQQPNLRTSVVPFPSEPQPEPSLRTHALRPQKDKAKGKDKGKSAEDDDSPLSRASLYVNPPTPMANPSTIPFVTPPPPVGARGIPAAQLAAMEAAEERDREREKERDRDKERQREVEREREERVREWERETERQMELEREREKEQRLREQREKDAAKERERERERERDREREREKERERERERDRERELEKERERAERERAEREREKAARAARRESRREDKSRRDEREGERTSRYEEQRPREERERTSQYDDRARAVVDERISRYEDKSRHEEKDRSIRHSKRYSVDNRDRERERERERDRDRSSRKEKKERMSTTETFRLVRSQSGNHYLQDTAAAIPVGQEQWTLVEAPAKRDKDRGSRKDKDRDRDKEREREKTSPEKSSRRRESRREGDKQRESVYGSGRSHHRHSSAKDERKHRSSASISRNPLESSLRHQRSRSLDDRQLNGNADLRSSGKDKEKDKNRRSSRRRDSKQANGNGHSSNGHGGHSSDSRSSQTTGENTGSLANGNVKDGASMDRHGSLRRAVSDVPAGAEQMMSIHAREAWDAERVWKGKSMLYDNDGASTNIRSGSSNFGDLARHSMYNGSGVVPGAAYMIQSPYYDPSHASLVHTSSFYAIPVSVGHHHASPPAAYPSQPVYSPGRYDYSSANANANANNPYRTSYPETLDMNSPTIIANPLPEPPRQSTYSPEPLVLDNPRADDPALTPEYWSVLAGITTH